MVFCYSVWTQEKKIDQQISFDFYMKKNNQWENSVGLVFN